MGVGFGKYRVLGTHVKILRRWYGLGDGCAEGGRPECISRHVQFTRDSGCLSPRTTAVPLAASKPDNVQNWLAGVKMGIRQEEDALRAVPGGRGSCSGDC